MTIIEKAIKGVECCELSDQGVYNCDKCPYQATEEDKSHIDWDCHWEELKRDVLNLLRTLQKEEE